MKICNKRGAVPNAEQHFFTLDIPTEKCYNSISSHSSNLALSFSSTRFSILEIYDRDIPSCFAISR